MELLGKDGQLSSGVTCLYQLPNGNYFFSEQVADEGEAFVFDTRKTCIVLMGPPAPGGGQQYSVVRVDKSAFQPTRIRVMKTSLLMTQDTTDGNLLKLARSTIAGLVMPKPGLKLPKPGEN